MSSVTKAVIPAAGYGTRMLPVTKTVSKEMLPIVSKPIIQYVVEELVEAGVKDIIMVTSQRKTDLVDYFNGMDEGLIGHLKTAQKQTLIRELENIHTLASIAFIEQKGVYGTGTPVLNAEAYLGGEPFIYTFADDFFIAQENSFQQMIAVYETYQAPIYGCQRRTADSDYDRYGYVGGVELAPGVVSINALAEQPGKAKAPGELASLGGFVVTPAVLPYLHKARDVLPAGKELYFNSALKLMIEEGEQVIAKEIIGAEYFDTGNKLEYMKTVTKLAAKDPEIGKAYRAFLHEMQDT